MRKSPLKSPKNFSATDAGRWASAPNVTYQPIRRPAIASPRRSRICAESVALAKPKTPAVRGSFSPRRHTASSAYGICFRSRCLPDAKNSPFTVLCSFQRHGVDESEKTVRRHIPYCKRRALKLSPRRVSENLMFLALPRLPPQGVFHTLRGDFGDKSQGAPG